MEKRRFPEGFVFGTATSSYQIEGATYEDGRGPCIWDTFARQPGKVINGESGDVACDHYHRYLDDVALLASLRMHAYRFSIAWPRLFPTGKEPKPLQAGLDFYDRLVDALLEEEIQPWVTLYHWDLPQALQDDGGWPNRDLVPRFCEYADAVGQLLGDRVQNFITHNEPWCSGILGYWEGRHAPGIQNPSLALAAVHHLLLSHGQAVPILRERAPNANVGITLNLNPAYPASESDVDRLAARRFDGFFNRWFLDPVFGRGYPEDQWAHYVEEGHLPGDRVSWLQDGDLDQMAQPLDFLGVNYYSRTILRGPEPGNAPRTIAEPTDLQKTDIGWEVFAEGLHSLLLRLKHDYPAIPLVITENGSAYNTPPDPDGRINDEMRVAYLRDHLDACWRAIQDGVDLRGYFAWSLMDNYEWAEGYGQRFGIVWVDYETQARIPKDSADFYSAVADSGTLP